MNKNKIKRIRYYEKSMKNSEKKQFGEPILESKILKDTENDLVETIRILNYDIDNLKNIEKQIKQGRLVTSGFEETIAGKEFNSNVRKGLSFSFSSQGLLEELIKVESELAMARSIYNNNSPIIKSLEKRLIDLKPLIREKQLEAVEAAISFNKEKWKFKLQTKILRKIQEKHNHQ